MLKKSYYHFLLLLLGCCLAISSFAYETQFSTGTEPIPLKSAKVGRQKVAILSIPLATSLEVSIYGEIDEKYDILRIYTMQNGTTMHTVFEGKGKVERAQPLIVEGNSIKVTLNSDQKTTRRGATVSIATLSPMTVMNRIKNDINKRLNKIEHQGGAVAAAEIDKGLRSFQQLEKQLQESKHPSELRKSVGNALTQLSYSYARISELKENINKLNQQAITELRSLQEQSSVYAEQTKARYFQEQKKINDWQEQLSNETDELAAKKLELSIKANESILKSLDVQYQIWQNFVQTQEALPTLLTSYFQHMDLLFYTLRLNAGIYREAANLIEHDTQFAKETLKGLSNLQEVLQVLSDDWAGIGHLQSRINEMDAK